MADGSKIEWLARPGTKPASWNPIRARDRATGRVGWYCTHHSPGCIRCYAEKLNNRLGTRHAFTAQNRQNVEIFLDDPTLTAPLRWTRPRTAFVCSMSDLFGEFVPIGFIDFVFAVMALSPQHTWIVLTKRGARMRDYIVNEPRARIYDACHEISGSSSIGTGQWPLPNVWLGVSVEDTRRLHERAPVLLQTPAAVRFLSIEPLLESLGEQLAQYLTAFETDNNGPVWHGVDWTIVGGESGPQARPFEIEWAGEIVNACEAADVPVFVKQMGARPTIGGELRTMRDAKGGDPSEWPPGVRLRQWPRTGEQP